jgi:hypothetical protein
MTSGPKIGAYETVRETSPATRFPPIQLVGQFTFARFSQGWPFVPFACNAPVCVSVSLYRFRSYLILITAAARTHRTSLSEQNGELRRQLDAALKLAAERLLTIQQLESSIAQLRAGTSQTGTTAVP